MSIFQHDSQFDDVLTDGFLSTQLTVQTSQVEAKVSTSRLAGREFVIVHNLGPQTIYVGPSGVNSSTGDPIYKGERMGYPIGDIALYMIATSGTNTVVVQEFA